MTIKAESFQSRSHVTTITKNFILVSLTSIIITYSVELLLKATVSSLLTHSTPYALNSLCTWLPTHSSLYIRNFPPLCLYTSRNILLRYLSEIVYLSRHTVCQLRSSQYVARKSSYWLDAIDASSLCDSWLCHQYWSE